MAAAMQAVKSKEERREGKFTELLLGTGQILADS